VALAPGPAGRRLAVSAHGRARARRNNGMMTGSEAPRAVATALAPDVQPRVALNDRALVEVARRDADGFAELYRRHVDRVYGFALRRSGSVALAEDVTSATFEKALRALDRFSWRGGGFGAWLLRIAANELAEHYRRDAGERRRVVATAAEQRTAAREAEADPAGHEDLVDGEVHRWELAELRDALGTLNPRYQQAISLRYLGGLTPTKAAEAMGCSKPVLAVTLHRALRSLRRAMGVSETGAG